MSVISNCFALGLLLIISMVFYQNKYFLTRASRYYSVCLILTAVAAVADIVFALIVNYMEISRGALWVFCTVAYALPLLSTGMLCLYLVCKAVEHSRMEHQTSIAFSVLSATYFVFLTLVITNIWTGHMFYVNDELRCVNGPIWFIRYPFVAVQALVPIIYALKNHRMLSKNILRAASEAVPILIFCVVLKIAYPDLTFLVTVSALIEGVFFLNFQNQRIGVNTLTKLNDRRRFFIELNSRIKAEKPFKVYAVKVEKFNIINNIFGYRAGDEILYLFAFSVEKLFSEGIAFHMHGATFALILPYSDKEKSEEQTKKLINYMSDPVTYSDRKIDLSSSIVEYIWNPMETDAELFYEKLEYALGCVSDNHLGYLLYSPEIGDAMFRKKYIVGRLGKIDRDHGFEIWFQPIYDTKSRSFESMETLLRLREPSGGMISPGEFIPVAEKTGQIIPITWFVIEEVCRALSGNSAFDGMRVSINLPVIFLADDKFRPKLNELVDGYGVDHSRLVFEFTERGKFDELDHAIKNMRNIIKDGYSFYLDDFGVGYSNFNCVLNLPITTAKLDMTLTSTIESLKGNYNLVNILTDLFHDMDLRVVAEGAETEEHFDILTAYGVDQIQGYYLAKPMPTAQAAEFIKKQRKK